MADLSVRGMPLATLPLGNTDLFYVVQGTASGSNDRKVQYKDLTNDSAVTPGTYGDSTHVGQFTVDQKGRISAASNVTISGGGGGSPRGVDPTTNGYVKDDFAVGTTTSGAIGEKNWKLLTATVTYGDSFTNHPGTFKLQIGGNSIGGMSIGGANSSDSFGLYADTFDCYFILRINSTANFQFRFGLWSTAHAVTDDPPANAIYFEALSTDASWFAVCRAGAAQTRQTTSVSTDTNFHRFRIRRVDASNIGFSVDGGTEVQISTNVPTGTTEFYPVFQPKATTATNKDANVDFWDCLTTLTR